VGGGELGGDPPSVGGTWSATAHSCSLLKLSVGEVLVQVFVALEALLPIRACVQGCIRIHACTYARTRTHTHSLTRT
jgi:hypothetical protein